MTNSDCTYLALQLVIAESREQIIIGIRSQELATFAMSRTHSSGSALLADLQEWERLYELRRTQFPAQPKTTPTTKPGKTVSQPNSYRRSTEKASSTTDTHRSAPNASTAGPRRSTTYAVRCYNCNTNGPGIVRNRANRVPFASRRPTHEDSVPLRLHYTLKHT